MKLRTGRKVGRTLYLQRGHEASDTDFLVGSVDCPALAEYIVESINGFGPVPEYVTQELMKIQAVRYS